MLQDQDHGESGNNRLKYSNKMLVALGANLGSVHGNSEKTLKLALTALENSGATIRAVSTFYHTPAFPVGSGPDYVNAAATLRANWTPEQAISILHEIEASMGRERKQRWGQRTLDLDLIAFNDLISPDPETHKWWRDLPLAQQMEMTPDELILPHPRVQDRAFVLVPLADVAPDWVHPIFGITVRQMLDALPDDEKAQVRPVE